MSFFGSWHDRERLGTEGEAKFQWRPQDDGDTRNIGQTKSAQEKKLWAVMEDCRGEVCQFTETQSGPFLL